MKKKGWLRIFEAFIAVILIASVLFIIVLRQNNGDGKEEIYNLQRTILEEISNNNELRQAILDGNIIPVNESVSERIPEIFEYDLKICEVNDICTLDYYKEEVYAQEVVISSTLEGYNPKKLKLFMWEK